MSKFKENQIYVNYHFNYHCFELNLNNNIGHNIYILLSIKYGSRYFLYGIFINNLIINIIITFFKKRNKSK